MCRFWKGPLAEPASRLSGKAWEHDAPMLGARGMSIKQTATDTTIIPAHSLAAC